jgi:hypothetical protein
MSLRALAGGIALSLVFLLAGLGVSLAGAAFVKGELPGEGRDSGTTQTVQGTLPPVIAPATPATGVGQQRPVNPAATAASATPAGAASPRAAATPRAATRPEVLQFVVCDVTVDCGDDPARTTWDRVEACLRVRPGSDNRPLVLVVTTTNMSPTGAARAPIIARSDPIPASETLRCHDVRVAGTPIRAGQYWMWLLDGETVLQQVRFRLGR